MIKNYIEKTIARENMSIEESFDLMNRIMSGETNNSQLASILTALKMKGESPEEIAGFAKCMRQKSVKIKCEDKNVIDVCGTGGDNSGTFNISTAVSFVVAGAGVKVAKHGNRSISSISGSADVLSELGIDINMSVEKSEKALNELGIAFLFAPLYHPAMKYAAPVRKELGFKTVFNMLGPLTNPASVKRQIVGVFNIKAAELLSKASEYLEMEKICFICTENKYDEISLTGETYIKEYSVKDGHKSYNLSPGNFNMRQITESQLKGGTPKENAEIILAILKGASNNGASSAIIANSALALYCSEISNDISTCKEIAEESLLSGKALKKMIELSKF